jgi:transcriptional regulator with GAF, ATPase, and Fis domain
MSDQTNHQPLPSNPGAPPVPLAPLSELVPPPDPRRRTALLASAGMVGESDTMLALADLLQRVADCEATVLVTGESGTGKELVARALHTLSRRASAPFVAINCAAMPETLLESELFGHVRGAFTDAHANKLGLFEEASHGTLFLDELGEIPPGMQAKLLRVLQERRVRPVGASVEREVDVRLLAATNKDLDHEVRAGRFRQDLYYRVNVVTVEVPPLRARGNDVLLLAERFISEIGTRTGKSVCGLSAAACDALLGYDWPGNVRELCNCIERAVALADADHIVPANLPAVLRRPPARDVVLHQMGADLAPGGELPSLCDVEKSYIRYVLEQVGGNKSSAARLLGIDRRTLHRKLGRMA